MTLGDPTEPDRDARPPPAIDRSVLGEWLAGDDAAIDELLLVFRDSIHAEQDKLRTALAAGDLEAFASAAHRLRGAALSMGARAVADTAGELYAAARDMDAAACEAGMPTLSAGIDLLAAEVPAPKPG